MCVCGCVCVCVCVYRLRVLWIDRLEVFVYRPVHVSTVCNSALIDLLYLFMPVCVCVSVYTGLCVLEERRRGREWGEALSAKSEPGLKVIAAGQEGLVYCRLINL